MTKLTPKQSLWMNRGVWLGTCWKRLVTRINTIVHKSQTNAHRNPSNRLSISKRHA